jgi:acetyl-CoA acetyltransferase
MVSEELGLAAAGEGPKLLRDGVTEIGGRCAINPSGGLLARGHPIGATGAAQLAELADQLRGRAGVRQSGGPRIALAENAGGHISGGGAACVITVLSAD